MLNTIVQTLLGKGKINRSVPGDSTHDERGVTANGLSPAFALLLVARCAGDLTQLVVSYSRLLQADDAGTGDDADKHQASERMERQLAFQGEKEGGSMPLGRQSCVRSLRGGFSSLRFSCGHGA